ncbi:MAG: copper chaperone CopZ [Synergistaceae bacterium]|jgi:copper chaperone|nr:copper chaperone CopZ [Synergistaceae bacterium]
MEIVTLKVEGMSCDHCVKAVTSSVGGLDGVESVNVSLDAGTVEVKFDRSKVSLDRIKSEIEDQGYDVAEQ